MMLRPAFLRWLSPCAMLLSLTFGCGDDDGMVDVDAEVPEDAEVDAGPPVPVSTDHCTYEDPPATANAGGMVEAGPLEAGIAEGIMRPPVGSTLGAYTARADFLGSAGAPDDRYDELADAFLPSFGIETRPMGKVLALRAGGETVLLIKADMGLADEAVTHEVARRVGLARGIDLSGKVLFATSHSHSQFSQYTVNSVLWVGLGRQRQLVFERMVSDLVEIAGRALDDLRPARMAIAHDPAFDLEDRITRDRRPQNDVLHGGPRKDHDLFVIRVDDRESGQPMAIVPVFGIHGTVLGAENLLAANEGPGAIERAIEERFDHQVLVMHMQGAGGDVSPAGSGGLDCSDARVCYNFARIETIGRLAADAILTAWAGLDDEMVDELAIEMVTRHIELGPNWENFRIRGGALEYAPMDGVTPVDNIIYDDAGNVVSPIDDFNAPYGAALCGEANNSFIPFSQIPGTVRQANPYSSCSQVNGAVRFLSRLMNLPFEEHMPSCATTRTVVSALRLGDHLVLTVPGETNTTIVDYLRQNSPIAEERTLVIGYAQSHVGYVMTVEDWLLMGYEPSINVWGPLEGEYIGEQILAIAPLALSPEREDATVGGADRYVPRVLDESDVPPPDPAPMAGTVEPVVYSQLYVRGLVLESNQPGASLPRLTSATFAWMGESPKSGTPDIRIERHVGPGEDDWEILRRRSGRVVEDQDVLLFHTPNPLVPEEPLQQRTHRWAVEWQLVTPWGTPELDRVEDRFGLPLGRYRFYVAGTGYELRSEPFEVVAAPIQVEASVAGGRLRGAARFEAAQGWRLLHMSVRSNRPVPANGEVTLRVSTSSGPQEVSAVLDAEGRFDVEAPAGATAVEVIDRFGNVGSATL
ncbi:MAG: neutral/alkaline non-lysosomal ceramidase N-terminal domain-containing protein [Myxococcales bacterium]|nr:neutral/alkaline non-lysosomal ceramidase N-terminal domain-containing protein [Myxococcales bacterium]